MAVQPTLVRPAFVRPSFVRRSARMRPAQHRAWDRHRHGFLVEVERAELSTSVAAGAPIDLTEVFGRAAPLIVEIGPGTGESLVPMARQRPEVNVLAFEVYRPALARLIGSLASAELGNVRVVEADAVDGLRHLLESASIEELWMFFPDPWPKLRHRKRRLLSADFVELAGSRLAPGGCWRLATDWPDYADQIRDELDSSGLFRSDHSGGAQRWSGRPVTRFEQRGLDAGREIFDLAYRRV